MSSDAERVGRATGREFCAGGHRAGLLLALLFGWTSAQPSSAQTPLGTGFTYQGKLSVAGVPATGNYDLQFTLYDSPSAATAVGATVTLPAVVVTGGLFTGSLDFGAAAFAGSRSWLEIGVRPAGSGGYTTLSPRQELTAAPDALWSTKAGDAQTLGGVASSGYVLAGAVIAINQGGTGATNAVTARANLQAARSGANSDITSLSGLTTPLAVTQGGTGAATPTGALAALNAQARVTGTCPIGQYLRVVNADGTAVCGTDIDTNSGGTLTSLATGAGLAGGPITGTGTLSIATSGVTSSLIANGAVGAAQIDASQVQARMTAICPVGQLLRGVNVDGSLQCFDLVDTNASVVSVTTSAPDGAYPIGSVLPILVLLSRPVVVVGSPTLTLETGPSDAIATYSFVSHSMVVFSYTVAPGHTTADLDCLSTTALALNGGSITVPGGGAASLTLPAPGAPGSISAGRNIVIDGNAPTVTNVTSAAANGSYTTGAVIDVRITFSEPVTVTGVPQLTLETGVNDAVVAYASGSGTSTLVFNYTVGASHSSPDLDYASAVALATNGGAIRDAAGNDAALTLPAPGTPGSLGFNKDIVILPDTIAPTVTNVTSSAANGTYGPGAVIPVQVSFSEPVGVTGTPQLTLETGGADAVVSYASGGGTNALVFNYTVASGHVSADLDYVSTTALALNGGTIRDSVANNAVLTLPAPGAANSLGANKNLVIDGVAPAVTSVTSSIANGTYGIGTPIPIQVTFSENVTVTGAPRLTLETGATDAVVGYASGSGTSTLVFNYVVASGEATPDLDYLSTGALALNGGTIRDTATNNAMLTLPAPGAAGSLGANTNIVVDGNAPAVTNVTSSAVNGSHGVGQVIPVQMTFSEPVFVTGTPQLTLETGTPDAIVNYSAGSGTNTLVFNYTVAPGNASADLDYVSAAPLALNGGTIRDAAANNATLTLPTPGAAGSLGFNKNLVIDTTAPTIINVTSPMPDGHYGVGQTVTIQVVFSEAVAVTGVPMLTLETGAVDAVVAYAAGSGTNTLVFNYLVGAGQTTPDLDYVGPAALALNGGTIKDAAGNNSLVVLPPPGGPGSLGFNKNIVIP